MASAPPSNENRETAAALALLLANVTRRYDLLALIRSQRIRPRPFRQIKPTNALAASMAAPHFAIVRAWADALPDILAAVPFGRAAVAAAIEQAAQRIGFTVSQAKAMIPRAVDAVEQFHRRMWAQRVKASTGLDVSMFTTSADVADPVAATTSWSQSLADDVHGQIRNKLLAFMLVAGITQADAKAKAADVIAKARARAAGIGVDQSFKLSRSMDRDRMAAAGVSTYRWHHTPQQHPRNWHLARDGKTFGADDIPADDRASVPAFCKCWEEPVLG